MPLSLVKRIPPQVDGAAVNPTVYIGNFTAANGGVYSPRTDTSNVNSEIYGRMPIRNSSTLHDNNNRVLHVGSEEQIKSGYLQSNSSLRAPIFYDSDDTSYYLNPNGSSYLDVIDVRNSWIRNAIYFGGGNNYLNWENSRINTASNFQANSYRLPNGFTISQGGSNYASINSWVYLEGVHGLYTATNGAHFYPNNANYGSWKIDGSRNGYNGIEFGANNGNVSLMVETNSATTGLHNNSYGWQLKWQYGTLYVGKGTYGGSEAVVLDSSNYTNYITPPSGGGGGGIHILTKPQPGWRYSNYTDIYSSQTGFNTASSVICSLFYPATDIRVSEVFIRVITAASTPVRGKIVIYADEDLGYPSTKIIESSALDLTTTGLKTFVVDYTFLAGKKYWLGFTTDNNDSNLQLTSPGSNANYIRHLNSTNFAQQAMFVPTWPGDFNNIPDTNTSVQTTSNSSVTVFFTAQ